MLKNTEKGVDGLILSLINTKSLRNELLDFPEEKDRNKWCLVKHLLLAEYHAMELINQNTGNKFVGTLKAINSLLENTIDNNVWEGKCRVCTKDLIINRLFKKRGEEL